MSRPGPPGPGAATAARFVVESVRASGIGTVFGVPGVHALGLWAALEGSGIRYVGFRHEAAAAHGADGYGRATGRPGAVFLSTGPGAINALSALAEAHVSSSPVLAVVSAIPTRYAGRGRGYLHETSDPMPAFAAVTRFAGRARSADELPDLLQRALDAAAGGRPGPALVEVPADVLDAPLEAEPAAARSVRPAPSEDGVAEAALLLRLAARPLIWAGGGVLRSGAAKALARVAELTGAPVVTTFMGKGAIPEDHPLATGTLVRQPEVAALLRRADLCLAVGTRFSGMSTANWTLELPSQLIHVDVDPGEIGRNYPVRLGVVADARAALEAIAGRLEAEAPAPRPWGAGEARRAREAALARARAGGPREMALLEAVRRAVPAEAVTVHDMTIPSYWAWAFLPVTRPGSFHSPYGFGSLGFSFPAALGVAAADPDRPVVAFCGDGGFLYHDRELATAAEHGLPVTALVFNDRSWGVLRSFASARYGTEFGLDLPGPDFVRLAESFGVAAVRAEGPQELEGALREAVAAGRPRLVEVPGAWAVPPPESYYA